MTDRDAPLTDLASGLGELALHRAGARHRPQRVVGLVERRVEHHVHGVADDLVDLAPEGGDVLGQAVDLLGLVLADVRGAEAHAGAAVLQADAIHGAHEGAAVAGQRLVDTPDAAGGRERGRHRGWCPRCGQPAGPDEANPPAPPKIEPYKTHLAYVKERRSDKDGAAILEEALAKLRGGA